MDQVKKQYKKMIKSHKAALNKISKNAMPWDYADCLNWIKEFLTFMQEYYKLGYNVIAMENKDIDSEEFKDQPTRYESITKALELYEAWIATEDEFFVYHETGGIENNKGIKINGVIQDWWSEYKYDDYDENYKKFNEEYKKRRTEFFKYLSEHLEEWWD